MVNTIQNAETRTHSVTSGKDVTQSTTTRKIEIENSEVAPLAGRLLRTRRSRTVTENTSNSNQKQSFIPMVQCKLPLDRINDILSKIKKTELSNVIEKSDSLLSDLSVQTDSNSVSLVAVNSELTTNVVGNVIGVETTLNKNVYNSPNRIMCLFCDRTFVSNILLQKHTERSHHISTTRRFSSRNIEQSTSVNYHPGCNFCSKNSSIQTATNLSVLFNHLLDEHAVKYFACRNCEIRFSTKEILISHNRDVHGFTIDNTAESLLSDGNCNNRERSDLGADLKDKCTLSNSMVIDKVLQLSQELHFNLGVSQNECSKNILFPPKIEINNINENIIIANENFENEKKGKTKTKKSILRPKTLIPDQKDIDFYKNMEKSNLPSDVDIENNIASNLLIQNNKIDEYQLNKKINIEQNAVIILDDINLDNKLFKNKNVSILSQLHVKCEEKDNQILSRLGIAQNRSSRARSLRRSRKTPHMENRASSETPRKDKVKTKGENHDFVINKNKNDPNSKFDPDFYSSVSVNVRENIMKYLDGKLGRQNDTVLVPDLIDPKIKSTHAVIQATSTQPAEIHGSDVNLNAITVFPTLLTSDQYGSDKIPDYSYGAQNFKKIITKNSWKWKWDPIKKYKYCNEDGKIVRKIRPLQHVSPRDLSKLDIWTQLTMREKFEKSKSELQLQMQSCSDIVSRNERQKQINELNMILDKRLFPNIEKECTRFDGAAEITNITESKSSTASNEENISVVGDNDLTLICQSSCDSNHDISLLNNLGLIQNSTKDISTPSPILSGEWARPRCYICCICGRRADCLRLLEAHQASHHPHVNATHYEIVGQELLDTEVYKYLYLPGVKEKDDSIKNHSKSEINNKQMKKLSNNILPGSRANKVLRTTRSVKSLERGCTKCEKMLLPSEFYRHILECAGDYGWIMAKKKCKYKPFGARRRRLKGLYKREVPQEEDRPELKEDRNIRPKVPPRPRTKPSDAETIQRMLANLPAKRSTRQIQDLPSSKSKSNSPSDKKQSHVRRLLDSPGNGKQNKIISSNIINSMKSALGKKVRHITRSLSNNQMPNIDNHNEETVPKDVVLPDNTDSIDKKYSNNPKVNDDQVKLLDGLTHEVGVNLNQDQKIPNRKNTPAISAESTTVARKGCLIPNEKTRNRSTNSKNDVSSAVNKCSDLDEASDKPFKKSLRRRPIVSSKIINNFKSIKVLLNKENVSAVESDSSNLVNDLNSNVSSETDSKNSAQITQPTTKKKRKPVKFPLKWIGNKKVHFNKSKKTYKKQLKNNTTVDSENITDSDNVDIQHKESDEIDKSLIENKPPNDNVGSLTIINNAKNEENLTILSINEETPTQSKENDEETLTMSRNDLQTKISSDVMVRSLSNQDLSFGSFSSSNNGIYSSEMYKNNNRHVQKNSQYDGNESTKTFDQHISNSAGYNALLLARGYNYSIMSKDDEGINEPIRGPNNAYYTIADNIDKPPLINNISESMNKEVHKSILRFGKLDTQFQDVSISVCTQSYSSNTIDKNESCMSKTMSKSKQVKSKRGLNDCIAMLRGKLGEKSSSEILPDSPYSGPTVCNEEYNDDTQQPLDLSGRIPQPEDLSMKSIKVSNEICSTIVAVPSTDIPAEKPISNSKTVSKQIYDPILKIPQYSLNQSNLPNAHHISIPCTQPITKYSPEPNKRVKCDFSIPSLLSPDKKVTSHSTINSLHYPQILPEFNSLPERIDHRVEKQSFKQREFTKSSETNQTEISANHIASVPTLILKSEKHPKHHFIDDILSTKKTNSNDIIKNVTNEISPELNNYSSIPKINIIHDASGENNSQKTSEVIEHVDTDLFLIDPVTGMITERGTIDVSEKESDSIKLNNINKEKPIHQHKTKTRKDSSLTASINIPAFPRESIENYTENSKIVLDKSGIKLKTAKNKSCNEKPKDSSSDFSDKLCPSKKNNRKNMKKSTLSILNVEDNATPKELDKKLTKISEENVTFPNLLIPQYEDNRIEPCNIDTSSENLTTKATAEIVELIPCSEIQIEKPPKTSLFPVSKTTKKKNRKQKESNIHIMENTIDNEITSKKKLGRKPTKKSVTPPPLTKVTKHLTEVDNGDLNATPNCIKLKRKSKETDITPPGFDDKIENNHQINTRNEIKIKFFSEKLLGDCNEKIIINESEFALTPTNNRDLITNDKISKCENLSKPTLEVKKELIMKDFAKKNRSKSKIQKKNLLDQIEDTSNSFSNNDISGAAIAPGELSTNDIQNNELLNKTISKNDELCVTPISCLNEESDDDICLAEMAKKKSEISSTSTENKTANETLNMTVPTFIDPNLNVVNASVVDENNDSSKIEISEVLSNDINIPDLTEMESSIANISEMSNLQTKSDLPCSNELPPVIKTPQVDENILKNNEDILSTTNEKKKSKTKNFKKHTTIRKSGRLSTYKDFKGEKIATINSVQLSENGHLIFKMQKDDGFLKHKDDTSGKVDQRKVNVDKNNVDQNHSTDSDEIKSLTASEITDHEHSLTTMKKRKGRNKISKTSKKLSSVQNHDSNESIENYQIASSTLEIKTPVLYVNEPKNNNTPIIEKEESADERLLSENHEDIPISLQSKISNDLLLDNVSNLSDDNKSKECNFLQHNINYPVEKYNQTPLNAVNNESELSENSHREKNTKTVRSSKRKSKLKISDIFSHISSINDSLPNIINKDTHCLLMKPIENNQSSSQGNDSIQNALILHPDNSSTDKSSHFEVNTKNMDKLIENESEELIKNPSDCYTESLTNSTSDNTKNYYLRKSQSKKEVQSRYDEETPHSSDNPDENTSLSEIYKNQPCIESVVGSERPNKTLNKNRLKMQIKINKKITETSIEDDSNILMDEHPKVKRSERKKHSTDTKNIPEEIPSIQNDISINCETSDDPISTLRTIDDTNISTNKRGRNKKTRKEKKIIADSGGIHPLIDDIDLSIQLESKIDEKSTTELIQGAIDLPAAIETKETLLNKRNCFIDDNSISNKSDAIHQDFSKSEKLDIGKYSPVNVIKDNNTSVDFDQIKENYNFENEKTSDSEKIEYSTKHKRKGRKIKQAKVGEESDILALNCNLDKNIPVATIPSESPRKRNKKKTGSSTESNSMYDIQADDSKHSTEYETPSIEISHLVDTSANENVNKINKSIVPEENLSKISKLHIEKSKILDNDKTKIKKSKNNALKLKDNEVFEEETDESHKKNIENNKKSLNSTTLNSHANNRDENYEIIFKQTDENFKSGKLSAEYTKAEKIENIKIDMKKGSKKNKNKHQKDNKSFIISSLSSNIKKLKRKHCVANNNDHSGIDKTGYDILTPEKMTLMKPCDLNTELDDNKTQESFDLEQSNSEAEIRRLSKIYDIDEDMDFKVDDEPVVKIKNKHKRNKQNIYDKKSKAHPTSKSSESDIFDYTDFDNERIDVSSNMKHSYNKTTASIGLKDDLEIVNSKIINCSNKRLLESQVKEINESIVFQITADSTMKKKKLKNHTTVINKIEASNKNKKKFKNQFLSAKDNIDNTYGSSDIENSYAIHEPHKDPKNIRDENIMLAKKDDKQNEGKFSIINNNKSLNTDDSKKTPTLKKSTPEDSISEEKNDEEKELSTSASVNTHNDLSFLNDKSVAALSTHDMIESKNHHDSTFDNLFSQKEKDHLKQVKIINNVVDKQKNKEHYEFEIKKKCDRNKSVTETITAPILDSNIFDIASSQKLSDNINLSESDKESLKQDKYLADFGMFTEKRPRKSTILAIKKINQTFKPDSSDTDDTNDKRSLSEFRQSSKPQKKRSKKVSNSDAVVTDSIFSENDASQNIDQVCDKSITEASHMTDSDIASFSEGSSIPLENKTTEKQETYCLICRRKFRRPENLLKHQITLTHISKLSEMEAKENKTKPLEFDDLIQSKGDSKELLIEINHNENASIRKNEIDHNSLRPYKNLAERKSFDHEMPQQTPAAAEMPNLKIYSKGGVNEEKMFSENIVPEIQAPMETARKELSRDEALFFECCSLLKGSETTRKQVGESEIYKPPNKELNKIQADKLNKEVKNPIVTYNLTVKNILQASEIVPEPLTKENGSQTLHVDIPAIKIRSPDKELDSCPEELVNLMNLHGSEIPVVVSRTKSLKCNSNSSKKSKKSAKRNNANHSDLDEFSESNEQINEDNDISTVKGDLEDTVESSPYCLESLIVRTNSNDFSDNADSLISSKDVNNPLKPSIPKEVKFSRKFDCMKHVKFTKSDIEHNRKNRKKIFTISSGEESDKNIDCNHCPIDEHLSTTNIDSKEHHEKKNNDFGTSSMQNSFIEFEDKFDKIKRKAREKAQAAQEAIAAVASPNISSKNRKKSHSKSRKSMKGSLESSQKPFRTSSKSRRVSKKKNQLKEFHKLTNKKILTKGARKVFDSIKVSIPTDEIHPNILDCSKLGLHNDNLTLSENSISNEGSSTYNYNKTKSSRKSDKQEAFAKNPIDKKLSYGSNYESGGENSLMQDFDDNQNMDIYEFLDEDDEKRSSRNFKFSSPRDSGIDKNVYITTKKGSDNTGSTDKNSGDPQNDDSQISSLSFSDRDDFNYASEDYNQTGEDTNMSTNSMEDINALIKFNKKNRMFRNKKVTKKSAIMGRIFKNNAIRNDQKTPVNENSNEVCEKDNTFSNRSHLDQLFDSLLEKSTSNAKMPCKSDSKISCELSELTDYCSTQDDIISPKVTNSLQNQSKESGSDFDDSDTMEKSIVPIRKNPRKIIPRLKARSSDDETSTNLLSSKDISDDILLNKGGLCKMYTENVGVAGRKSQRKCTTGKQNVLVESWSSESDFEDFRQFEEYSSIPKSRHHRRPRRSRRHEHKLVNEQNPNTDAHFSSPVFNESPIDFCKDPESDFIGEVDEYKDEQKKDDQENSITHPKLKRTLSGRRVSFNNSNAIKMQGTRRRRKPNQKPFDYDDEFKPTRIAEPLATQRRNKRSASEMLYYWSSSSDEEPPAVTAETVNREPEPIEQHGWIVGDSHKKLVTMLAHAKGRKLDDKTTVKEKKTRIQS